MGQNSQADHRCDFHGLSASHSGLAGLISVELNWEELKPYLASSFNPALLPQSVELTVR